MVVILSNCGEGLMRLKQQKNSIYFGGRTAFHYKYAIAVRLSVCEKKQECKKLLIGMGIR